jgi:hypothetical protein
MSNYGNCRKVKKHMKKKAFAQNTFSGLVLDKASKFSTIIYILPVHHEGMWGNGGMALL